MYRTTAITGQESGSESPTCTRSEKAIEDVMSRAHSYCAVCIQGMIEIVRSYSLGGCVSYRIYPGPFI